MDLKFCNLDHILSASDFRDQKLTCRMLAVGECGGWSVFQVEGRENRAILYFRFSIMNQTKSIFIKPSPHCEDDPNLNYLNIKYSRRLSRGRHSDWKIGLHYTFSTIPPSSHLRANQFKTFGKWPECWVLRPLLSRVCLLLLSRQSADQRERYFLSTQV